MSRMGKLPARRRILIITLTILSIVVATCVCEPSVGGFFQEIEKGVRNTGKAMEKGVRDTGKTMEKGVRDTGKAMEKGVRDTGKAMEKGVRDTGKAIEKAGQDIGRLFKELVNFNLSCDLPQIKPADLATFYRDQCGSTLATYRNDIDVCNHAGGISLLSAGVPEAAGFGLATTAGATYLVAKVAFELCQKACRSKREVEQCINNVDASAKMAARQANAAAKTNADEEARLELFRCIDEAYATEKLIVIDNILADCEARKSCNTEDSEYTEDFIARVTKEHQQIDTRREKARSDLQTGISGKHDYGPNIETPILKEILLTENENDTRTICVAKRTNITVRARTQSGDPSSLKVRWLHDQKTILMSYAVVTMQPGWLQSTIDLTERNHGRWEVQILGLDGRALGSFGFLYRPEPINR